MTGEAPDRPAASPAARRLASVAVALVLVGALALRLAGNTYGLPFPYAPDEVAKIDVARTLIERDFAHPPTQPSFLYYSLFVIVQVAEPLGSALSRHGWLDPRRFPAGDPVPFLIWLGRCFLAVLGTATVWLVYRLGRELAGRAAGMLAALVYAASPLAIAATQYVKEDTPLALWTTAALYFAARAVRRRRRDDLVLGGAASGLAFASKFSGVASVLVVLAAAALAPASVGAADRRRTGRRAADALAVVGSCVLAFVLACPVLATRPGMLLGGIGGQSSYLQRGHHDGIAVSGASQWFTFYLRRAIVPGLGWPALAAAVAGAVALSRRNRGTAFLLVLWSLGYTAVAEAMPAKPYPFFARYVLPALPPLAALAGVALARLAALVRESRLTRARRLASAATVVSALALVVAPAALRAVTALPDTRDQARAWALANVPAGAVLWVSPYGPPIGPAPFEVRALDAQALANARRAQPARPQWALLVAHYYARHLEHPAARPELAGFLQRLLGQADAGVTFSNRWERFGYANPVVRVFPLAPE